ncbi:MOSC domain-containing protein [bacterium]|nr:MOSC domain-containing protein [bacterium]
MSVGKTARRAKRRGGWMVTRVDSVQVGKIASYKNAKGKEWTSAIKKSRVDGFVQVEKDHIAGDQQADLKHHGGLDKAVLAYSSNHFAEWNRSLGRNDVDAGWFGENLTISGLSESEVCVGDTVRIGTCTLQVSQPRQPCWKLSRFWNVPELAVLVQKTGRTGWYLRVVDEGNLSAGDALELLELPFPEMTIAWANSVMHAKPKSSKDDLKLSKCPALSGSWSEQLARRAAKGNSKSETARLFGDGS